MARRPQSVTDVEAIARRLKLTREATKLNQASWCKLVGMSTQAWNNYERGLRRISVEAALQVCIASGATLDWIYRGIAAGLPVSLAAAITELDRAAAAPLPAVGRARNAFRA